MIEVRRASAFDMKEIIDYSFMKAAQSPIYGKAPIDVEMVSKVYLSLIASAKGFMWVSIKDNKVVGYLAGMVDNYFFSKKKYASDLLFVADYGGDILVREFISWAKKQKNVVDITLGVTSDLADPERIGKLYTHNGMHKVGGIYRIEVA